MKEFALKIFAADRVFYNGPCESLVIPTVDGLYGILAGHENLVVAVSEGKASFSAGDNQRREAVLSPGICIIDGDGVLLMVETAESPDELEARRQKLDAADLMESRRNRSNVSEIKRAKAKMARTASGLHGKDRNEID